MKLRRVGAGPRHEEKRREAEVGLTLAHLTLLLKNVPLSLWKDITFSTTKI